MDDDIKQVVEQYERAIADAEQMGGAAFEAGQSIDDNPFSAYGDGLIGLEEAWNAGWDYAEAAKLSREYDNE